MYAFHLDHELDHHASRNHQSLLDVYLFSLRAHPHVGVAIVKLYLASGSYLRAMTILNPILLTSQMGHLDGLMTNQPMITHNCGVMHLVFLTFGGGELGVTQLWPWRPRSSQITCSWT